MNKIKSLFLNIIFLLGGSLITLIALTSCENFLVGAEVRKEIEENIAYNNAKDINVLIMPEIGTGTIVQNTNYTAKLGYSFEISFAEASEYSFVEWIAVDKNNPEKRLNDGVIFDDARSATTKVKISTDSIAVKIIPSCEKRIALSVEPSPRYDPLGVSRDRSITVTFTKSLARSSFIYAENEIPAGAQIKKNEDGEIWAYTFDGQTYLKNISITNADDYSIAEHFTCPLVNDKLLTIAVDKNEPIKFNSGEVFKTVKVTLSKDICDTKGIKMNTEKSWNYQITESTDDKASVNLTSDKGSVYLAGTKDYSIGQKITLSLTEDADYQFVRWDYDSSIIYIAEPENPNTTATVLEKTQGENTTQIKAICAPRLRVLDKGFSPLNDSENPTVSKNSSIIITFNQNLPDDEEGKKQLENISITIGGSPVKSSFKAPVISENTVTFVADNSNMLDVPAGQTKTVSVTVPADLYYKLDDGTKICYGANGISFNYKIDETTLDKAEITVTAASGSGTLKGASGSGRYSIGQEVSLVFEPADGWQFNGWSVTCGGEAVPESQIKIADKNALSTKLTVYEALAGLLVTAKTSECLSFTASPSAAVNPKDSEIKITFNKNLASDCASLLDKILINSGDLDVYYETRELDGNTITIKNTSPLSVAKDTTKLITVTVPSDFYYMNDGNKVNLERKSFSFKVDYTTNAKTKVTYSVINGENDSAFNPSNAAGLIEGLQSNLVQYNIGEEVPLSFALADGYQFYGWKITDANGNLVTEDTVSYKNNTSASSLQPTLEMKKAAEGLKISAVCYKRPSISTANVSPYNANPVDPEPKNTPISLTFAHAIEEGREQYIEIKYSVSSFSQSTYFSRTLSSDKKTVTFTPIKMLPVENAFETVTVTVPHDMVYYLAQDGKTKITPSDEDFSWSYRVNSSTMTKTIVRLDTTDANGSSINVNNIGLAGGTNQTVNVEESHSLVYPLAQGYKFMGWKLTCATSGYTVSKSDYVTSAESDYVTSGTITVNIGTKPYFTLTIDSSDPTKATIKSYDAIGNGTGNYGLTIAVKDSLLPKITATGPAYSTGGIDCDTSVTVTFNKAINTSTVTLGSSGTIQIVDPANENEHYESYFNTPSWSENTVTIKPKYTIQELVSNGLGPKTLKVKFNLSSIKDSDGNTVTSSPESFTYRINDAVEKDKPEWQNTQYLYDGLNSTGSLSTTDFSSWNSSDYTKNHIKDSVRFSFYGYDKKSGLKALRITETYYKTVSGGATSNETIIKDYSASQYSSYYATLNDGTPYYRFTGYHNLQTVNDGVIKLDFQLLDNAENESTKKTYYVIKDTVIDETVVKFDETKQNALTDLELRDGGIGLSVYNKVRKRNGDNDTVTLTLSSIPQDTFYGSYKTAYNITVKYGYTKEDIPNEASKTTSSNSIKFTFTHNTRQVTFVKIIVSDAAGNTKELLRALPGQAVIASYDTYNDSMMNWDYCRLKFANETQYKTLCSYYGASSFITNSFYKNTTDGDTSWIKDVANCCPYTWSWSDQYNMYMMHSGKGRTFYIYGLICFKYGDSTTNGDKQSEYWYSSLSDDYVKIIMKTDEDNIFQSDSLVTSASTGLSSNYVIDFLKVTTEPVVNSGCYKVVVDDEFISRIQSEHNVDTTGITYSIIARNSSGEKIESKDFTFYLPSPGKYELFLKAENSNRQSVTTSSYRYLKINGTGSDREQYLTFTDDLTAPALNVGSDENFYSYSPAYWYTYHYSAIVSDNGTAGLVTDSDGKVLLDYYFIPNSNSTLSVLALESYDRYQYLHNTYTLEELESQYSDLKKTIAVASDATSLQIPFDGLAEGLYTICIVAKDNNGNYTVKCRTAFNKRLHETLVLSKLYSNAYSYFFRVNKRFEVKWLESGAWTKKGSYANYEGQDPQVEFNKGSLGNWWIKIDAYFKNGCSVAESGFYDTTYLNLGYYKQLWEEGAAVMDVSSKNIIPGMNGMQVLCTSPTLAHTMYCSRKLSDGTSAEDIATWENMAMETGIVEKSSNFTYGNDKYDAIPSGYYYTTIVHFADGTTLMTEVKQK